MDRVKKIQTKVFLVFMGAVMITVFSLLMFVQSRYFADSLKKVASRYLPTDLKISADFTELEVKLIPPGLVIKNPSLIFQKGNPANLPVGTKLDAQFIDVTFQFFQILTGAVNVNALMLHGATLKLNLDPKFFSADEPAKSPVTSHFVPTLSWDSLFRFQFRSIGLAESLIDLTFQTHPEAKPIHIEAFAKELTMGRNTIDRLPAYDLAIDLQRAYVDTVFFKHPLSQFQASAEISSRGLSIRNLSAQEGDLGIHASGNIKGNLLNPKSLKSDLTYMARGPLSKWLAPDLLGRLSKNIPQSVAGTISVDGKLRGDLMGPLKNLDSEARVVLDDAKYEDWYANKVTLRGAWGSQILKLEQAEVRVDEGTLSVNEMEFDPFSNRVGSIPFDLKFDNFDFRRAMGKFLKPVYPLHMRINGGLNGRLTLGDLFAIDAKANFKVRDFSFDNQRMNQKKPLSVLLAIPEISLASAFHIDKDGLTFENTTASLARSNLKARGSVTAKNGFDIDVQGPINASDIGKLGPFPIKGEGDLHWTIKGKVPNIILSFEAALKDAEYLNLKLGKVNGKVIYDDGSEFLSLSNLAAQVGRSNFLANGTIDMGPSDDVRIDVQVPQGTISDFAAVFNEFIVSSVPWYPYELSGQLSGVIRATGKTSLNQLSVLGDLELQNIDYQRELFRWGKLRAGYNKGAYVAEGVNLKKKNGWLRGNFNFGADNVLNYDLSSDGLTTLDVDHLGSFGIPYRAPLTIEARGTGKLGSLKSSLRVALGAGVVKNYAVAPSELSLTTGNGKLESQLSVFGNQVRGQLSLDWEKSGTSILDIVAKNFDFQPILVGLNTDLANDPELDSDLSGSAHLKFNVANLSRLSGTVDVDSYLLKRTGYSLRLVDKFHLDFKNGNHRFSNAKLSGEGTNLVANGGVEDGVIDYTIRGTLNLGIAEFVLQEIASIKSIAQVDAKITGRADSPNVFATINGTDSDLRLRNVEQPFEDLKFKTILTGSTLRINEVTSRFAGGTVRGQGLAEMHLSRVPEFDLKLDLDGAKVKVYPVTYARASGRLSLKGSELPYKVKGNIKVSEALVRENFSLSDGARTLRTSKFLPQKGTGGTGDTQIFDLDIDIAGDRNIFIRNDLFDAELKADLKIINTIQTPRILGNATVLHGKLLFKDNFFTLQSSSVRFNNPSALDPEFDLTGQAEVKGYKILILASGKVTDYKLNFQSQPPLAESDIVNLLTLGVTSSGFNSLTRENRDAYSRDEMYGLLFEQSGINKGLQEKLGVKVRLDQSQVAVPENVFRAKSGDANETVAPKVVLQKQITKNLNASVGSTVGVGDNQERNADLEYNLPFAKNFSVLGTYEDQRGLQLQQSRTSVGADLKFKMRFK